MRIACVGGMDRSQADMERLAQQRGHSVEFHTGDVRGRGADALRGVVERAELVLVVTDLNSHGGVQMAKKLCHRIGRSSMVVKRCGSARFAHLLDALATRDAQLAVAS
ncbi:MAG: DUF2325 domain-containing protein [Polyangiaceae bacterium]